jgi:hypothetical protein
MDTTQLDKETQEYMLSAARGEVPWFCPDCGASFQAGMPDKCIYGHESCNALIRRDKEQALL